MSGAKTSAIRPLLEYFSNHPERAIPGGESKAAVLARYKKFMRRVKAGDVIVGGGNAAAVPMFGGKAGEIKEIEV